VNVTRITKNTLVEHTITHVTERPFSCSVCSQSFNCKSHLSAHIHTGEKPYTCAVCKSAFKWKNALMEHTRIHTGEKPFNCSVCAAAFRRKQDFIHRQKHTNRQIKNNICFK
uniref:C2H2-type domain-containing protein n=1 Tax=Poecilia latipinna TaxID=48699 RepID=A0A3B3UV37_9TELE